MSSLVSPGVQITAASPSSSVFTEVHKTYPIVKGSTYTEPTTPTTPTTPVDESTFYHYMNTDFLTNFEFKKTVDSYYAVTNVIQDSSGNHLIAVLTEYNTLANNTPLSICTATSSNKGSTWQCNYDNKIVASPQNDLLNIKFTSLTDTEIANGVVPIVFAQTSKNMGAYQPFMYSTDYGVTWSAAPYITFNGYVDYIIDMDATYYNGNTYLYVFGWNSVNSYSPPVNNYISVLTNCTTWSDSGFPAPLYGYDGSYGRSVKALGKYLYLSGYHYLFDTVAKTYTYVSTEIIKSDNVVNLNNILYEKSYFSTTSWIITRFDPTTPTNTSVIATVPVNNTNYIDKIYAIGNSYVIVVLGNSNNAYLYNTSGTLISSLLWTNIDSHYAQMPFVINNIVGSTLDLYLISFRTDWSANRVDYDSTSLSKVRILGNVLQPSTFVLSGYYTGINYSTAGIVLDRLVQASIPTEVCAYATTLSGFKDKCAYSSAYFGPNDSTYANSTNDAVAGYIEFQNYGKTWDIKIPITSNNTDSVSETDTILVNRMDYFYSTVSNDTFLTENSHMLYSVGLNNNVIDISTYKCDKFDIRIEDVKSNSDNTESCYFYMSNTNVVQELLYTFVVVPQSGNVLEGTTYNVPVQFSESVSAWGYFGYDKGIAHVFGMSDTNVWYFSYNTSTQTASEPIMINGNFVPWWFMESSAVGNYAALNCMCRVYDTDGYSTFQSVVMSINLTTGVVSQIPVGSGDIGDTGWFAGSGYMAGKYYFVGGTNKIYKVDLENNTVLVAYNTGLDPSCYYVQTLLGDSTGDHIIAITSQYAEDLSTIPTFYQYSTADFTYPLEVLTQQNLNWGYSDIITDQTGKYNIIVANQYYDGATTTSVGVITYMNNNYCKDMSPGNTWYSSSQAIAYNGITDKIKFGYQSPSTISNATIPVVPIVVARVTNNYSFLRYSLDLGITWNNTGPITNAPYYFNCIADFEVIYHNGVPYIFVVTRTTANNTKGSVLMTTDFGGNWVNITPTGGISITLLWNVGDYAIFANENYVMICGTYFYDINNFTYSQYSVSGSTILRYPIVVNDYIYVYYVSTGGADIGTSYIQKINFSTGEITAVATLSGITSTPVLYNVPNNCFAVVDLISNITDVYHANGTKVFSTHLPWSNKNVYYEQPFIMNNFNGSTCIVYEINYPYSGDNIVDYSQSNVTENEFNNSVLLGSNAIMIPGTTTETVSSTVTMQANAIGSSTLVNGTSYATTVTSIQQQVL